MGISTNGQKQNGLVDYNEALAVTGRWTLRDSRVCQLAFLQECDKDHSRSVAVKEWLDCFKITTGDNVQTGEIIHVKTKLFLAIFFSLLGTNRIVECKMMGRRFCSKRERKNLC